MSEFVRGNAVVGQSGGPTAVINQSLVGVIEALAGQDRIHRLLGAHHGVRGIVGGQFIDLKDMAAGWDAFRRSQDDLIISRIKDMTDKVAQIATAAEQQSAAAEEINRSIEDIAKVASEAEDDANQTAQATRDLAQLSQELLTLSRRFTGE